MNYKELNDISIKRVYLNLDKYSEPGITFLHIDFEAKTIELKHGHQADKQIFEEYFIETKSFSNKLVQAGYINKAKSHLNFKSDIIFINKELLTQDVEFIELILIHELCHLIEQSDLSASQQIEYKKEDIEIGKKIDEIANERYLDNYHNEVFGKLLSYYIGLFDPKRKGSLIAKSMKLNFIDDYTNAFESIILACRS